MQPGDTQNTGGTSIGLNVGYFKSVFGIVRCVELLFTIIVLSTAAACDSVVCPGNPHFAAGMGFVIFVTVIAMLGNICIIVMRTFNLLVNQIPMNLIEVAYSGGFALLYFISGIIAAAYSAQIDRHNYYRGTFAAAATFSFFNMILYGLDAGYRVFTLRQ